MWRWQCSLMLLLVGTVAASTSIEKQVPVPGTAGRPALKDVLASTLQSSGQLKAMGGEELQKDFACFDMVSICAVLPDGFR